MLHRSSIKCIHKLSNNLLKFHGNVNNYYNQPIIRSYNNSNDKSNDNAVYVKSYFLSKSINIDKIKEETGIYGSNDHIKNRKSVSITLDKSLNQYISIFNFGAVVFFNIPEALHIEHINNIKELTNPVMVDQDIQSDYYKIVINENLEKPSVIKAEHVNIQQLDSNNITIIGSVMAQSVALDYYGFVVEQSLQNFSGKINSLENGGDSKIQNEILQKFNSSNISVLTNVLSKLGVFEGNDAAWDNADYYYTWESLRKEFEIDLRYRDLSLKLDVVNDNTRFFIEMLQFEKSYKMEKTIIYLLIIEILINLSTHLN